MDASSARTGFMLGCQILYPLLWDNGIIGGNSINVGQCICLVEQVQRISKQNCCGMKRVQSNLSKLCPDNHHVRGQQPHIKPFTILHADHNKMSPTVLTQGAQYSKFSHPHDSYRQIIFFSSFNNNQNSQGKTERRILFF